MTNWTFALITPDGFLGGAFPQITRLIEQAGFDILVARPIVLDEETIRRLYISPHPRPSTGGDVLIPVELFADLYQITPGCLLILGRQQGDAINAMLRLKGHTRPELARPGTIRSIAENGFLNYSHCPDTPADRDRELAILTPDATNLQAIAESSNSDLTDLIGLPSLLDSAVVVGERNAISFPATAIRLLRRAIALLATHADEPTLTQLRTCRAALDTTATNLDDNNTSQARMSTVQDAIPQAARPLTVIASELGQPAIAEAVENLLFLFTTTGRPRGNVFPLALSPLERIVLDSHAHTHRL
ncbi:nucleoside-diphosphate kinase [Actinokineospora enzanensis]|uniref:nucleoside-diphosphate kinase n=1 Tax=Actinokineospora enzanensis TaxID=155975 RepID=UPI00038186F7|nr:nucleoside-diphosphate kinase [Actinokineospora enzanensis]